MNPLDAGTPQALFGEEACENLRALKRAYARLIRAHGPERDPAAFQHIRALYEDAREALERGEQAAPDEGQDAERAWVEAALEGVTADTVEAVAEQLRQRALAQQSAPAAMAAFGLTEALDPRGVLPFLAALAAQSGQSVGGELAVRMLDDLLLDRPGEVNRPEMVALIGALGPSPARVVAQKARVRAHLLTGAWASAWEAFKDCGDALRAADADDWRELWIWVYETCAWEMSEAELEDALARLGMADFPLDDAAFRHLTQLGFDAMAYQRARADAALPPAITDAARLSYHRSLLVLARAAARLGSLPDVGAALGDALERHPGLGSPLHRLEQRLTGGERHMLMWLESGGPVLIKGLDGAGALREGLAHAEGVIADDRLEDEQLQQKLIAVYRRDRLNLVIGAGLALFAGVVSLAVQRWSTGAMFSIGAILIYLKRDQLPYPEGEDLDPGTALRYGGAFCEGVAAAVDARGLWIHEAAAAASAALARLEVSGSPEHHALLYLRSRLDTDFESRAQFFERFGEEHLRRAVLTEFFTRPPEGSR